MGALMILLASAHASKSTSSLDDSPVGCKTSDRITEQQIRCGVATNTSPGLAIAKGPILTINKD